MLVRVDGKIPEGVTAKDIIGEIGTTGVEITPDGMPLARTFGNCLFVSMKHLEGRRASERRAAF